MVLCILDRFQAEICEHIVAVISLLQLCENLLKDRKKNIKSFKLLRLWMSAAAVVRYISRVDSLKCSLSEVSFCVLIKTSENICLARLICGSWLKHLKLCVLREDFINRLNPMCGFVVIFAYNYIFVSIGRVKAVVDLKYFTALRL